MSPESNEWAARRRLLDYLRRRWSGEPVDEQFERQELAPADLTALDLAEIVAAQITDQELEESKVIEYLSQQGPKDQHLSALVARVRKLAPKFNEHERDSLLRLDVAGKGQEVSPWPDTLRKVESLVHFCQGIEHGAASTARQQAGAKEALAARYLNMLRVEGFAPDTDRDGDVRFKFEGGTYLIILDESDPVYLRLVYPNFWALEDDAEKTRATRAAQLATAKTKGTKVYVVAENVWASIEAFYPSPDTLRPVLLRSLQALKAGVTAFVEAMRAT